MSNVSTAVFYRSPQTRSSSRSSQWQNQPQSNAMASGVMLFIAGGMDLAYGLGWSQQIGVITTEHLQYCWFIGFIAGAMVASPLISFLPKKVYLIISSFMVLASGIIYVSVPHAYNAILAARYVNGIGVGFSVVAFIVLGTEIAAPSYRGSVLSLEQYAFTFGLAIQVIYASQWTENTHFPANRLHGIFLIVFALLAFGLIYFVIESPVYYLRRSNQEAALDCLRLLQRPQLITNDTKAWLENLRMYVAEEKSLSANENIRRAINPFIKMLLYRCMIAFSFSIVLNYALIVASFFSLGYANSWPPIVFVLLRVFGTFLAIWSVDSLGRKSVALISLLCMGGLTIGVGIILGNARNLQSPHQMSIVCSIMLIAQFFAGLFVPSTSIYLGEAFPLAVKPYLIAFCVSMEQLIQIIGILTFRVSIYNAYVYCISVGVIICGLFIYFCLVIPETRNTTLNEAQKRFRNLMNPNIY